VDEALDAFRKSVELDPTGTAAHRNLDTALATKRRAEQAQVKCRKATDLAPMRMPSGQSNKSK
jgi:Flp pilus assembly protein TadD